MTFKEHLRYHAFLRQRSFNRITLTWLVDLFSIQEGLMYAIIESGGKQYRVQKGDVIDVELLDTEANGAVEFKQVLFINNGSKIKIGSPHLSNSIVRGEFVSQISGPKVVAFKYKERKGIRRKVGHRQKYARVKITDIQE